MPTLDELLINRDTYPDTTKITLAEGVETTLGDLRKNTMLERDYRQKTGKLADERRKFETERSEWESARLEAEAKLTDLARQLVTRNPEASRDEIDDILERDPVARKLMSKIESLETKIGERDKSLDEARQRIKLAEENYIADQHRRVLAYLKQTDPELDEVELVNFARANYIPRLDWAHRLMTEDRRTKTALDTARKEAHEEGYKKAKADLLQPTIPSRKTTVPAPDAPKTLDEAAEAALRDPEILQAMNTGMVS